MKTTTLITGPLHMKVNLTDEQYELLVKLMKICPELNKLPVSHAVWVY